MALEALGVEACRSAPNRDPGELGSITLMLPRNRPGGGVPIGAGRDPIKAFILEAIPMPSPTFRVGSRLGAETQRGHLRLSSAHSRVTGVDGRGAGSEAAQPAVFRDRRIEGFFLTFFGRPRGVGAGRAHGLGARITLR